MLEKPENENWKSPEFYRDEQARTFKLYKDVHWFFGPRKTRMPNSRPVNARFLMPEIQEWLETTGFPHKLVLSKNGRSRVTFEQKQHAILFKLTWV